MFANCNTFAVMVRLNAAPLAGLLACAAVAICVPQLAGASATTGEIGKTAAGTALRIADTTRKVPTADTIEIISPTSDQTLGVIIYRLDGDGRATVLNFGGPR